MSKPKHWATKIEEHGVRVRIYEREDSWSLWYSTMKDGRKLRRALDTSDRTVAEQRARAIACEIAKANLTGVQPNMVTLGQVFALYRTHKLPGLAARKRAETRMEVFLEAWGEDALVCDLSQTHVDSYSRRRMGGTLGAGNHVRTAVRAGTVHCEFSWLSSAFNFARRHRQGGRRFLQENPLIDVSWPKEKNPMRPVASHQRFVETLNHVDTIDAPGRLRCMLNLARYTGRRVWAICQLRASDFLRDPDAIRVALASMGFAEDRANHMPHGAIRWRGENDKMGFATIAPLGQAARAALDTYTANSLRVGDTWLFPGAWDGTKSICRYRAAYWLLGAERLAGLPKLERGVWHPYRRLWASERKHLPDVDVAAAGGWRDTSSMKASYQQADAATQLQVVEEFG